MKIAEILIVLESAPPVGFDDGTGVLTVVGGAGVVKGITAPTDIVLSSLAKRK